MTSFEDDQREEEHRQQRQNGGGWCPIVLAGIVGLLALAVQTVRSLGQGERTGR